MRAALTVGIFVTGFVLLNLSVFTQGYGAYGLFVASTSGTLMPAIAIAIGVVILFQFKSEPFLSVAVIRLIPTYPIVLILTVIADDHVYLWMISLSLLLWVESMHDPHQHRAQFSRLFVVFANALMWVVFFQAMGWIWEPDAKPRNWGELLIWGRIYYRTEPLFMLLPILTCVILVVWARYLADLWDSSSGA